MSDNILESINEDNIILDGFEEKKTSVTNPTIKKNRGRPALSEEERKQRKKERNSAFYEKNRISILEKRHEEYKTSSNGERRVYRSRFSKE